MNIVLTPTWFTLADILIELFSFIILSVFFWFSVKNYKINKNKKSLHLGWAFLLIAIAEISTILTKFVIFYDTSFTQRVGQMIVTYNVVKTVNEVYEAGFFIHKLLTLLGLYVLYRAPEKKQITKDFFLTSFFIIISALFGQLNYYIFHITALILLILIINNYSKVYEKNKNKNTKTLLNAFTSLAISQVIFILSNIGILYAIAQIIQLISYLMLLFLITKILKYGNTKTKSR